MGRHHRSFEVAGREGLRRGEHLLGVRAGRFRHLDHRGDVAAVFGLLDENIEWNEAENFIYADKSPYVGPNALLNGLFSRFDQAAQELGVEKIKTVGDAYMAVCGLPIEVPGTTLNRLCGSSLDAIGLAARSIKSGEADLLIAGGAWRSLAAVPVLEEVSLALDPYPRAPGAKFEAPKDMEPARESPFAVLKALKEKPPAKG